MKYSLVILSPANETHDRREIVDLVTKWLVVPYVFRLYCPPAIPYRDTKGGIRIFLSRVSLEFDYEQTDRHEGLT